MGKRKARNRAMYFMIPDGYNLTDSRMKSYFFEKMESRGRVQKAGHEEVEARLFGVCVWS